MPALNKIVSDTPVVAIKAKRNENEKIRFFI